MKNESILQNPAYIQLHGTFVSVRCMLCSVRDGFVTNSVYLQEMN